MSPGAVPVVTGGTVDGTTRGEHLADEWDALRARATPVPSGSRLGGALGGTALWWLLRVLVPGAYAMALALEYALCPELVCTVEDPCPGTPAWSALDGWQLGAAVALWFAPGAALPVAGLTSLVYVVDHVLLGTLASGSGVASLGQVGVVAGGAALLLRVRRTPLPRTGTGRLPARGRELLLSRGLGTAEVAVALGLVAAVVLAGWFTALQTATTGHQDRGQEVLVEVTAVDEEDWLLDLRLPGGRTATIGVYDTDVYTVGDRVPAVVDTTVDPPWVSLVQEPVEHDGWLVLACAVACVCLLVGISRRHDLRRRRQLLDRGGPVWATTAAPGADGARVLLPALRLRAPLARTQPADEWLEAVGLLRQQALAGPGTDEPAPEDDWTEDDERRRQQEFAAAWRGERTAGDLDDGSDARFDPEPVEQVLLIGDPRPGGVVVVVTSEVVLAPYSRLDPMSPLDAWRLASAADDAPAEDDDLGTHDADAVSLDAAGLPGVAAAPLPDGVDPRRGDGRPVDEVELGAPRWRRLAAAALLALPAAFWLAADGGLPPEEQMSWVGKAWALAGAGWFAFGGLAFSRSRTHLRPDGVLVRAHGFDSLRPWHDVAGVRVVAGDVVVAFGVDDDGDVDGVAGPPAGLAASEAGALAERWRVAAGPAGPSADAPRPRRTVDPVVGGGVVLYALGAAAVVLWPLLQPLL